MLYLFNQYHVVTTSGSSGIRGIFIYDWNEWNEFYTCLARYGLYQRDKTPALDPALNWRIAVVNISNPIFATYSLHKTFSFEGVEKFHFPIPLPIEAIIAGLNRVQADIVMALPPTIRQLAQEAQQGRLTIQPKIVSTFGEPLSPSIRNTIKHTWPNVAIFNTLSASEGFVAANCHADSKTMHFSNDACIIELMDINNNPVKKNIRSHHAYLTNLYNYTLPLIRYELPEQLLFLDKTCECGSTQPLIAEPLYRPEFDFTYRDNITVHHSVFDTPLLLEKNIREFQVTQTTQGADIQIVSLGRVNIRQLEESIGRELEKIGLLNPQITVRVIDKIDYPASGKLRRFLREA